MDKKLIAFIALLIAFLTGFLIWAKAHKED